MEIFLAEAEQYFRVVPDPVTLRAKQRIFGKYKIKRQLCVYTMVYAVQNHINVINALLHVLSGGVAYFSPLSSFPCIYLVPVSDFS